MSASSEFQLECLCGAAIVTHKRTTICVSCRHLVEIHWPADYAAPGAPTVDTTITAWEGLA